MVWKEKNVEIIQENSFPDEATTQLTVNPQKASVFTLKLRYPSWVEEGKLKVAINGKPYVISQGSTGYISIERKWKKGDKVTMKMPMRIAVEQLPDKSNYYSILYGPLVLAAKTGAEDLIGLFADDSRGGHIAHGKKLPLKEIPIIVSDPDNIASLLKPVEGKSLAFTLRNLYSEKYPKEMELIPFFRLHESRYIIYWPQATAADVKKLQERIADEEKERERLDAITSDKVICGEQQPESDHFIQSEKSRVGFDEDVHWRDAQAWFSYEMKNQSMNAKYLYLKYFDIKESTEFDVLINDNKVTSIKLDGKGDSQAFSSIIEIPTDQLQSEKPTVRFVAKEKSRTAKMIEIRLLIDR
ncbi:hypothetical protein FACS1894179_08730 [Bacteroidia bacterium]|nr:hypothetical protein FACS1894179_08730 [Bacteroidia bacterium]